MTSREGPGGICLDYGRTLVEFARPVAAIAAAGAELERLLPLPGTPWQGRGDQLALALDERIDELVEEGQRSHPWREVEIESVHRRALGELLAGSVPANVAAAAGAVLQRAWVAGVAPIPEALPVLEALRGRGLRLGLCSNAPFPPSLMREQLVRLGLSSYFHATLFSSEIGWRKPDPRIFAELLRRLSLPAERVWFIGDEPLADIEGARGVGIRAILAPGAAPGVIGLERLGAWDELLALVA